MASQQITTKRLQEITLIAQIAPRGINATSAQRSATEKSISPKPR